MKGDKSDEPQQAGARKRLKPATLILYISAEMYFMTRKLNVPNAAFHSLCREVRGCSICAPHLPHGPRPVFQAHPAAKILIAGQAPGSKVHATGIPFDDPSGERLRNWMGIDTQTFYDPQHIAILPMGFCYPGKGTSGDMPPRPECAEHWRNRLLGHLPNIQLTLLIGQYAMHWHLKERMQKNLTETVRNWREYWPEYIVLPHPSPRNNIWLKKNPWFVREVLPTVKRRIAEVL